MKGTANKTSKKSFRHFRVAPYRLCGNKKVNILLSITLREKKTVKKKERQKVAWGENYAANR